MKGKFIIFILMQVLFLNLHAQDPVQQIWNEVDADADENQAPGNMENEKLNRWSYSTSVGSSVAFSGNMGSFMNVYLAPKLQYTATKRLMFHGGLIASQLRPLYNSLNSEGKTIGSYFGLSAFVAASYRLTDDLVVYGSGIKSMMHPGINGINPNLTFDDISFGAAYSIGNFTIGASFHSGPSNRFNSSPFNTGRAYYPSPIYW